MKPMLCPDYTTIGNGICDSINDNFVCYYDGGDCYLGANIPNCTSFDCMHNIGFDPCPKFGNVSNGMCEKENFNLICSFDGEDCHFR